MRPSPTSTSPRLSFPTPDRATVVTLHNTIDLPTDLSDPNSQKKPAHVLGLAMGDTSGYPCAPLCRPQGHGRAHLDPRHRRRRQARPASRWSRSSSSAFDVHRQASLLAAALLLRARLPNWGWAIIIVTVVFNLLMLPTRLMMMKSSLKMMRIQPKVDALKQRYAHLKISDPKRAEMNTEMMALYKAEGVNMYGGCLPMLIQMPLFFAYYRVLANVD